MSESHYTVSFRHTDGSHHVSRVFSNVRAARKWFTWLSSLSYVAQANLHRGNMGEELLDQIAK